MGGEILRILNFGFIRELFLSRWSTAAVVVQDRFHGRVWDDG